MCWATRSTSLLARTGLSACRWVIKSLLQNSMYALNDGVRAALVAALSAAGFDFAGDELAVVVLLVEPLGDFFVLDGLDPGEEAAQRPVDEAEAEKGLL